MYIIGSFFGKIFLGDWCNIRVNQYERELINVMTPPPPTHTLSDCGTQSNITVYWFNVIGWYFIVSKS